MGLRINTNLASIAAQRQMSQTARRTEQTMKALSSGNRFADPTQSSAEFAISEHLRGQISGMKAGKGNAESAFSFVQVAEGGLNEQNNILIRQRELAIQSASDTYSDTEREMIQMEYEQLSQEFDRIAKSTRFGSNQLLDGTQKEYEFQIGAFQGDENIIRYTSDTNTTSSALNMDSTRVDEKGDARDALESIDEALNEIGNARANFAAMQSRLNSAIDNQGVQIENLSGAYSRMADTDYAAVVSEMFKNQALQQYQTAVLAQANQQPMQVLKLIA